MAGSAEKKPHTESAFVAPPALGMDADALARDFAHYFNKTLGRRRVRPDTPFIYQALTYAIRDRLMERWNQTNASIEQNDCKVVSYLSMEFLVGRLLRNALINLDLDDAATATMERIGLTLEDAVEQEHEAGLGNGGLGRLAACFLDSCATLALPVIGYGIRYQYGMFRQRIENGYQIEDPDVWLQEGFPWEVERIDLARLVKFGGRSERYVDQSGQTRYRWVDTHDVRAIPFDVPIPGYRNDIVNTLRLWSAAATDAFDLSEFNSGSYTDAVATKNAAENITMVLYPNATTEMGKELRLRQQYFLVSASLQDCLHRWEEQNGSDYASFSEKNCFQLNDTHPAIAVPELMRLLMDEKHLGWDDAWSVVRATMAYTNHTLLPEALELWPVDTFRFLLPRLLDIIFEINAHFIAEIGRRWPGDNDRVRRMSIIQEGETPMVRMAYLAIVGSFSINGVAALHSQLLKDGLFRDFNELWPERFNNKTNGVTQRRWLVACNPDLARLISEKIDSNWVTNLERISGLQQWADDADFRQQWLAVKSANKKRLVDLINTSAGITVDAGMLFDVQVKRIHEYKRQILNVLHAIHLYAEISAGESSHVPRAIIIGGKAAPGYVMAKNIVKFINNVASVINDDPATCGKLRLVFIPNYNVSAMEIICPAADVSAQISTAGKEASGTGNMKFMMNGAVTIGTLDGANVEIREAVGDDNFFLFGHTVDEIAALRSNYDPNAIIESDADFKRVMHLIESGCFNRFEPGVVDSIVSAIRNPSDQWMTAADFRSFIDTHQELEQAYRDHRRWARMSILNTAASGRFSTDRTMQDYNSHIWRLQPVKTEA